MTKRFWLGMMVVSLLVTAASGGFLYRTLKDAQTVEVPLQQVETPAPPAQPVQVGKQITPEPAKVDPVPKTTKEPATLMRNILFTFHSADAKEVYLVGGFNEWNRNPFSKKNNQTWTIAQKIKPGTYNYLFVVDGKRVRDPNNKRVSKDGESVITVKPLN